MQHLHDQVCQRFGVIRKFLSGFWTNEQAQDLTEYALLLAFVVLASAAMLTVNGASVAGIWTATNGIISSGNQIAKSN